MKRVLVTGGTGFVGRHVLTPLHQSHYEVHAITSSSQSGEKDNVQWHQHDLLHDDVQPLVHRIRPTHLLHLAWDTTPGKYSDSDENLRWLKASLSLLEAFAAQGGERVVMAGSCAEYDWEYGVCIESKTPCSPTTLYGHCKHAMQKIGGSFCQEKQVSFAQGRVFFLYGEHEHSARFIPQVINGLFDKKPTPCTEGRQLRDFLYVKDAASAFVSLLNSDVEGAVNIASGKPCSLRQIVELVMQYTENSNSIKFGELEMAGNEPDLILANTRRLNHKVKWQPEYSLEQGLKETVDWWKKQKMGVG